ncbi:extracellular nuclease [Acinetobacter baumannii]|nr:extracellular nuclease [Acinetobacter baumannii]SSS42607.1 extracellular nuclease [Acinetobacter baumannii]
MFYGEDAYRSSDHDPVIVDLDLNGKDSNQPNDNQKSPIFDFLSQLMEWISQLFKRS